MNRFLRRRRRGGFTLIELLVVMFIIGFLFALGAVYYPGYASRQAVASGADKLSGAMQIAKQRAKRDLLATGVRLINITGTTCNELQYIQQPDDFALGRYTGRDPSNVNRAFFGTGANYTVPVNFTTSDVIVGDFLELNGGALVRRITAVGNGFLDLQPNTSIALPVSVVDPTPGSSLSNYRVVRQPRAIAGEPTVKLPDRVVIELGTSPLYASDTRPLTNVPDYVLFLPSGAMVNSGTSLPDNAFFWVRHTDGDPRIDLFSGNAIIISVAARTGFIASHPPSGVTNDPYSYSRDGRSSGS